ncbi:trihelix transcription factor ASR3-like [Juglans microcarpa x Juglans regia]|uniref:trihelix transcription factor ASR3-like n=1 Tax=Juglans microcarpa x Juglans regia TaxID=2249226 RepID=UPI001B7EC9BA|nr:trihelix transcription factor ASR3-like [Juglans microcarpa x Juglans regia]
MASETQLISLAQNGVDGETDGARNGVQARPTSVDGDKTPRLPRWTRQEILVLIQGKRVAETRGSGRSAGLPFGSGLVEPKWASVSSYCKRHGVNRGPIQCRKRWSNLAGDYKKIREWESQAKEGTESYWVMRNDLRRDRKLPGFFDKEVYDILESGSGVAPETPATALALAQVPTPGHVAEDADEEGGLFDSQRSAVADDGLFSDFEQEDSGRSSEKAMEVSIPAPMPISEKHYRPVLRGSHGQGTTNEKQPASNPEIGSTSLEDRKRKRVAAEEDEETVSLQNQLIDVLERNGQMLTAQLEAQNENFHLDREQRKDDVNSLIGVLNKLSDALARIADKL